MEGKKVVGHATKEQMLAMLLHEQRDRAIQAVVSAVEPAAGTSLPN